MVIELAKRRDIVENPKGTAIRRGDEIVLLESEIVNGHERHVQAQGLPVIAVIERDVNALFSSRVQQNFANGILAHHAHEIDVANAADGLLPGLTKIMGTENVRMQVVEAVAIDRGVRGAGVEVRSFQHIDGAPNGERWWRDVFPSRAGIFRQLDISIVAANPNQAFTDG